MCGMPTCWPQDRHKCQIHTGDLSLLETHVVGQMSVTTFNQLDRRKSFLVKFRFTIASALFDAPTCHCDIDAFIYRHGSPMGCTSTQFVPRWCIFGKQTSQPQANSTVSIELRPCNVLFQIFLSHCFGYSPPHWLSRHKQPIRVHTR